MLSVFKMGVVDRELPFWFITKTVGHVYRFGDVKKLNLTSLSQRWVLFFLQCLKIMSNIWKITYFESSISTNPASLLKYTYYNNSPLPRYNKKINKRIEKHYRKPRRLVLFAKSLNFLSVSCITSCSFLIGSFTQLGTARHFCEC